MLKNEISNITAVNNIIADLLALDAAYIAADCAGVDMLDSVFKNHGYEFLAFIVRLDRIEIEALHACSSSCACKGNLHDCIAFVIDTSGESEIYLRDINADDISVYVR